MKQIIFLFYFIGFVFTNQGVCTVDREYSYEVPDDFKVLHTWEENGVLSIVDTYGNSVDIYVENVDGTNVDINNEISLIKSNWADPIIEETSLAPNGYLMRIKTSSVIDPVDTIVVIPKRGFLLKAFFLKDDDSRERGAFEEEVIKMMRDVAQGGSHEKAWADCVRTFVNHLR